MKNKILLLLLIFVLNSIWLFGNDPSDKACVSYYTWEPKAGTNGTIQFNNLSSGDFNTWMWDFGDGTTSGMFNPEHEFNAIGTYYICLSVSDGINCFDTYCDTVFLSPECHADFDITYVPTTPPLVQFTDLSTGFPDHWFWDFGDGETSHEQNPAHIYYYPGTYEACLVIQNSDSSYNCTDSICKTVIIPDTLNCEASYTYHIDEENPLEVQFIDQSTGNITDWEWDFGDGTVSQDQNPLHSYDQAGQYLVCLKVENSDTLENCLHFICETIGLNNPVLCDADFIAIVDSGSQVMYRYNFLDQTSGNPDSWLWNFGDGSISHEQNPQHIYDDAGTYEICLNTWNSSQPGCNDSYCILVQTANYFQLGGLAFIGENPLNNPQPTGDTGIAILYRQRNDLSMLAVDTNVFHELGYYWFTNMMEMDYILRISLTPGSDHYNNFIPSYFPGNMSWQEADAFMLDESIFEMNTSLMATLGVDPGPGIIAGRVVSGTNFSYDLNTASFHDIPVILTDQSSVPLDWTTTNEYGEFEFNSISFGSYLLYADVAGIWSQAELVVLNEEYPINDTILIKMYDSQPFSIEEPSKNSISISALFPNPVVNNINLQLQAEKTLHLEINIVNIVGQRIYTTDILTVEGVNTFVVPTDKMPSGIYVISIREDGQQQLITKKFIKN
jgi:PKD repeat protein